MADAITLKPYESDQRPQLSGAEPGVRMLHGRPYVFDSDALAEHFARIIVDAAPANLNALPCDQLKRIERAAWRCLYDREQPAYRAKGEDVGRRVWAVLKARGWNTDGTRQPGFEQVAA